MEKVFSTKQKIKILQAVIFKSRKKDIEL